MRGYIVNDAFQQPAVLSLDGINGQPLSIRAKTLIFSDPLSLDLLEFIERIAPSDAPVLISGESGTGKELFARHIHTLSNRSGPFVAVNCGAINKQLADSELFGHAISAFADENEKREGWFEAANNGTLFLDEICDLPLSLQIKLLRVLQEKAVTPVGFTTSVPINVRLVAASNIDLNSAVTAGNFRRDLLYRINIAHVKLPALRYRQGDILPLAEHFLKIYSQRMNCKPPHFSTDAIELLLNYSWPGNTRELENVIHFALLVAGSDFIDSTHIKVCGGRNIWNSSDSSRSDNETNSSRMTELNNDPMFCITTELHRLFAEQGNGSHYEAFENLVVSEAFIHSRCNQVKAAALLGVSRNVMRTLLKRYDLVAESCLKESMQEKEQGLKT
jgi:DNA-binding NtrC family response regulator